MGGVINDENHYNIGTVAVLIVLEWLVVYMQHMNDPNPDI